MTGELALRWLVAFAITQAVECPIYKRFFDVRLAIAFAASAITHPFVALVIPAALRAGYIAIQARSPGFELSPDAYRASIGLVAEVFAVLVEAAWLARLGGLTARRAFVASLVANVASSSAGGLVYLLTGWP